MREYFSSISFAALAAKYPVLCERRARYDPEAVRQTLQQGGTFEERLILPYLLWQNLAGNQFLVTVPQPRRVSESRPLLATSLFDLHVYDRGSVGFPMHVRPAEPPPQRGVLYSLAPTRSDPAANLAPTAWETLRTAYRLRGDLEGAAAKALVQKLFHLTLAIAHAPQYEADHQDSLAQDWIHLPIPREKATLDSIAKLGDQLAALLDPMAEVHALLKKLLRADLKSLGVDRSRTGAPLRADDLVVTVSYYAAAVGGWREREPSNDEATRPLWGETTGDLWLNDVAFLANVPQQVWRYELVGYPVIKKWLGYRDAKRRPGRGLTLDELDHLRGMIHRIADLLTLRPALDAAYAQALDSPFTADELGLRQ